MPLTAFTDTQTERGERRLFAKDPDTGKPAYLFVRAVDEPTDRQLRRSYAQGKRLDQMNKQKAADALENQIAFVRARAAYALTGSEDFTLRMGNEATAAAFSEALGAPVKAGADVTLDGKWNPAVKELAFAAIRQMAGWVSDQADEISGVKIEEEEEAATSFR